MSSGTLRDSRELHQNLLNSERGITRALYTRRAVDQWERRIAGRSAAFRYRLRLLTHEIVPAGSGVLKYIKVLNFLTKKSIFRTNYQFLDFFRLLDFS